MHSQQLARSMFPVDRVPGRELKILINQFVGDCWLNKKTSLRQHIKSPPAKLTKGKLWIELWVLIAL